MRETTLLFGQNKSVVGIVTDPIDRAATTACLLLNAGFIHRVGPQRMYVQLARRLAAAGMVALRFDYSGVGDSEQRYDNLPFAERAVLEAQEAMDCLQSTRGIQHFLMVGICWGADNALRVSGADERVVGASLVDFYAVNSLRCFLRQYPRRLLSSKGWKNVITGNSALFRRGWHAVSETWRLRFSARNGHGDVDASSIMPLKSPDAVLREVGEVLDRGVDLRFLFASGGPSWDHYHARFREPMKEMAQRGRLRVDLYPDSDHIFTLRYNQRRVIDSTCQWAEGVVARLAASTADERRVGIAVD